MKSGDYTTIAAHVPGVVGRAVKRATQNAAKQRKRRVSESAFVGEIVMTALANEIEAERALEAAASAGVVETPAASPARASA